MYKLHFLIGFVSLSIAVGHVIRDAPMQEFSFENLFKSANEGFQQLEKMILDSFGASDTNDLKKKAEEQGEALAKQFDTWAENIKKDTEDLKDNPAVKEIREAAEKAIEDFKTKHPETAADIKDYAEKANKGAGEILTKIKSLTESKEAENIKDLSQKLIESAKDAISKLTKSISEDLKKD